MSNYIVSAAEESVLPCCCVRSAYEELCSFIRAALTGICCFDPDREASITIDDVQGGIIIRRVSSRDAVVLERPFSADSLAEAVHTMSAQRSLMGFSADEGTLSAVFGDVSVSLTATEFRLFSAILESGGDIVSAEHLSQAVWGRYDRNLCTVYLSYLRRKLDSAFGDGTLVSVRGKGYLLKEPDNKL